MSLPSAPGPEQTGTSDSCSTVTWSQIVRKWPSANKVSLNAQSTSKLQLLSTPDLIGQRKAIA